MTTDNLDTKSQGYVRANAPIAPGRFMIVGVAICILFWMIDSAVDTYAFHEGTFSSQLFSPSPHKLWMRLPVLVFIIGLSIYARITVQRLRSAETKVALSENRYKTIFENIHDVYYETDLTGKLLEVGPSIETVSGYTRDEVLGRDMTDFYEDPHMRTVLIETIQRSGVVNDFELRLRNRDGSILPVSITSKLIYDEQGAPTKIIGSMRDISKRVRAEDALRNSEDLLRSTIESANDGVLVVDMSGKVTHANIRFYEMWSIPEELRRIPDDDHLLEFVIDQLKDPESFLEKVRSLYESPDRDLDTISFKDGRIFDRLSYPLMRHGQISGRVWTFRDVSERMRAEKALQESQAKQLTILETIEEGYYEIAIDGKFQFFNSALCHLMGYSRAEMQGMRFTRYVDRATAAMLIRTFRDVFRTGKTETALQWSIVRKDRERRYVEASVALMKDLEGQPLYFSGIVRDVTERKRGEEERRQLEAQVQHAQKLESLGVLAGGIAHDFNNLLAGIMGFSSLALMKLPEGSQARDNILQIEKAARRAADLTRQMLAYSGQGRFEVGPLDLSVLVRDIANLLQVSISKKATLRYDFAEKLPSINADEAQLQQVIMNLITNASEALEDRSGTITVRTGTVQADYTLRNNSILDDDISVGEYAFVEVSDNGCGMDAATLPRVFEPFFTTKFTGRGLGLAALLGIVRGHKGAVTVDSEQGRGTTFTVFFPTAQPSHLLEPRKTTTTQDDWRPTGTVLVADDEEVVRAVCKETLESIGLRVVTVEDGEQCVQLFREDPNAFDLVLLDLSMPKMSGDEVFKELIAIRSDIRVLLTTGYTEQELVNRFQVDRLAGFIQKPYEALDLITAVRSAWRAKNIPDDTPENYHSAST